MRIPSSAATARSPGSTIRTATAGCSRKSPRGCPDAWTLTRHSAHRPTSQPRFGVRQPRMASTRSATAASMMRIGRTGTPRTSLRNRPARNCRNERRLQIHITAERRRSAARKLKANSKGIRREQYSDEDRANNGDSGADGCKRFGAGRGAGPALGNQANRPAAPRSQRPRTRSRPGPGRPRAGSGLRQSHPCGRRDHLCPRRHVRISDRGQAPGDAQGRRRPLHPGRCGPCGEERRQRHRKPARHLYRRERQPAPDIGGVIAAAASGSELTCRRVD